MRLRVWLPPLAELRPESQTEFEILDAHRRVLNRGEAVLAGLPDFDCELVLDANDVLLLEIELPKMSGSMLAKALPALVEERLVGEVEDSHVIAGSRDSSGRGTVAVTDSALLKRALALFQKAGRRVVHATPQPLALNMPPGGWRVRWRPGSGSVRTGQSTGSGLGCENGLAPLELRLLLAQAAQRPSTIEVDGECDIDAWAEELGITVTRGRTSEFATPVVLDLLQYELAPSLAKWSTWRTTAILGVALVAIMLGGLNVQAWTLRAKERTLKQNMVQIVKEAFPRVPVVLDPLAQMRRLTAELRTGAGTEQDGFLRMVAGLGEVAEAGSVESIEYRDGRLIVQFAQQQGQAESQRGALVERAMRAGLALRFEGKNAVLETKRSL
jgi:general secretion pathway protein L